MASLPNKRKIFNDPVYGFITIPDDLTFDLIEHPWFQRLRRIKQLGLTHLVYPGALHTRFHHALGTLYLVRQAVDTLRIKGHSISRLEEQGLSLAILLHDIGHGPFSHALEHSIVGEMSHEEITKIMMDRLNTELEGQLELAISIFRDQYPKRFLHQLVSSQLDMDRMDYLKRDSFYTGVSEGVVNSDRILNMLNVVDDELVVEEKGIYSVEKFIVARRLMYWQVYLHKTVLVAEQILVHILLRAKELTGSPLKPYIAPPLHRPCAPTPPLQFFLSNDCRKSDFLSKPEVLENFTLLDDYDIFTAIKVWTSHPDNVLSFLCRALVDRHLFRIEIRNTSFDLEYKENIKNSIIKTLKINENDMKYFLFEGCMANNAYDPGLDRINLLRKDGSVVDISEDSAQLNISVLSETVVKYYLAYPKNLRN